MSPEHLNETLNQSASSALHVMPSKGTPVPTLSLKKDGQWQQGVRHMWNACRAFKQHSKVNLQSVLRVWRQYAIFKRDSKTSRANAKQQLVDEFLHEAGQCQLMTPINTQAVPQGQK